MHPIGLNPLPLGTALPASGASRAAELAAARVHVQALPSEAPRMAATADSIQLYACVADRVEVATRLALGRALDVRA